MITKAQAVSARSGQNFYHATKRNSGKSPLMVRVSGQCKTWVTRPTHFKLPVKYGLFESGYITHENAEEWVATEQEALQPRSLG